MLRYADHTQGDIFNSCRKTSRSLRRQSLAKGQLVSAFRKNYTMFGGNSQIAHQKGLATVTSEPKNMILFSLDDSFLMHSGQYRSREIERACDSITAAKEMTLLLFEARRKLESKYPLPARFSQYYAPLENLKDCEFFENDVTDYSPRHIKSQFLLRLALTIDTRPSLSHLNQELVKIDNLIRQLALKEDNYFKIFLLSKKKKQNL
uniref:Uncharacterized protein n=1 Tax=Glossina brevipalpis TaxID=37001 RepID=A0A1A9WNC1_9MUSC